MGDENETRLLYLADKVYGTLLHLYPKDFRFEFGAMMARDFHDLSRDIYERNGTSALPSMWLRTFIDLTTTAIAEHVESRGRILMNEIPKTIDRYEILQTIADGAASNLYLAFDPSIKQEVILKVYLDNLHGHDTEAEVLSCLGHPAIPKLYNSVQGKDTNYLVLELIDGEDLLTRLEANEAPLSERELIEWGMQVCDFLIYMHTHAETPLIFRDVKPANIMIRSS